MWKKIARTNTAFLNRCPLCVQRYAETHHLEIELNHVHISGQADPVLTGPLAEALDTAMRAEGILVDVRMRVLSRLYRMAQDTDTDRDYGYIAALLRTTAAAEVAGT